MLSAFILVMALLVVLVAGIFVMGAMSMRRQPSADPSLSDDRFARLDQELEREAVPKAIADDEDTGRFAGLDRWRDDGGQRAADPR